MVTAIGLCKQKLAVFGLEGHEPELKRLVLPSFAPGLWLDIVELA
jgi:hypothetical protein